MKNLIVVLRVIAAIVCAFGVYSGVDGLIGSLNGSFDINPELTKTLTDKMFWSFICLGMSGVYGVFGYWFIPKRIEMPQKLKNAGIVFLGFFVAGMSYHMFYKSIIAAI